RLLGKHEMQSPDRTGPKGCPSRKLSSNLSSTEDLAGGQAGGHHPRCQLSESNLVADRDDKKSSDKPGADVVPGAPRYPCKLEDIAEAGPHGPNVLLLIQLKL